MRSLKMTIAVGALALMAGPAFAMPISGKIGFGGNATPVDGVGDPLFNFTGAVGIDVEDNVALVLPGSTEGNFAGLEGSTATFNDFTYSPATVPVDPLWSIPGSFSFVLESITIEPDSGPNFLNLSGTGTIMGPGFDDTEASWSFSGNTSTADAEFVFSADNAIPDVPEPATLALVGGGLLAAGGMAARRRRRAA